MEPKINQNEESWDFRKIFALLVILGILVFGFKTYFLDKNAGIQVKGVTTKSSPLPEIFPKDEIRKTTAEKLNELKNEVNNVNVVEIATSTPQVQKILNDLKNLQNLPQSQARQACFRICEGL